MSSIRVCISVIFISTCLSGCAAIERPELQSESVLPLHVLTEAINCELQDSIAGQIRQNPWLRTWQGQYSITLKANQIAYVKASTSTFPIVLPKSSLLNLGIGAGLTTTSNKTALYKYNIEFSKIDLGTPCRRPVLPDGHPFLQGEIGFHDWIDRAIAASGDQNLNSNPDQLSSIGHTFEFSIDTNGAVSPSFVLMPAPAVTLNPTASFDRLDDSIVDVSFGKVPPQTASISDIEKLLNKDQQKDKDNSMQKILNYQSDKKKANKILNEPDNKSLLELDQKISNLTIQLGQASAIQGVNPQIMQIQKGDIIKQLTPLQTLKSEKTDSLKMLRQKQSDVQAADAGIEEEKAKIKMIDDNPQKTQTVTRQVPAAVTALSPDLNPNVAGTLLQLQLERLVGTRLTGN